MRSNLREALKGMKDKIRKARGKSYADGGGFDAADGAKGPSGGSNTDKPGKDPSIFKMPGKPAGGKPVAEAEGSAKADMTLAGMGLSDERDEELSNFMKKGDQAPKGKALKALRIVAQDSNIRKKAGRPKGK